MVTSSDVGMPVTTTYDGVNSSNTPSPVITSTTAEQPVTYVPTPGAADDN